MNSERSGPVSWRILITEFTDHLPVDSCEAQGESTGQDSGWDNGLSPTLSPLLFFKSTLDILVQSFQNPHIREQLAMGPS